VNYRPGNRNDFADGCGLVDLYSGRTSLYRFEWPVANVCHRPKERSALTSPSRRFHTVCKKNEHGKMPDNS
jgi:hypothetical protein